MSCNVRRGRQARQQASPATPAVWPGVHGGRYRPLTPADAKLPDCQAGYEKALAVALAAHTRCNNVSESAGMLGSVLRTVRGIEVNEETLSFDVMEQVVGGEGHFLRTEYEYPGLADRRTPGEWESAGSPDIRKLAGERVKSILSTHYPEYDEPAIDSKIRDIFPILLPRETMSAASGRW